MNLAHNERFGLAKLLLSRTAAILAIVISSSACFAANKPNVLFIVADDLRAELGCLGDRHVISPNLDRLASRGRLFTRAYCQQAVCNPSRASFMTGLRPDTIKVWDLKASFRKTKPKHPTLPELFKQAGYRTRCIGKIYHNSEQLGDPASWSKPAKFHFGPHWADTVTANRVGAIKKGQVPAIESFDVPDEAYWDGRIARQAVSALGELKDKPFFLAVGFWRPHLPFVAPKRDWDLYNPRELPAPTGWFAPSDCPPLALHNSKELKGYRDVPKFPLTPKTTRDLRHGYYASITFMDRQIGLVLDALEENGLRKNTIVVFFSDHGFHLGEHELWCKTSCFEFDARVPMIIATPEIAKAGTASSSLVELIDLYPTLADLAGLEAPKALEGESLVPVLNDPTTKVKEGAFTQHPRPSYSKGTAPVMGVSVRTENGRYTEWRNRKTGKVEAREYYDHRIDPFETRNVANVLKDKSWMTKPKRLLDRHFPHR
ncbi:MAG: iduronate sulfatase [Verrucomicrobiales bacterium]|nr:iduronate sulfatase [Verrucomicrobiales bacterium]|tara:strand:- start:1716 stop:3176 length:1461 start_codon:yes stop_codon:yes gene_type:complete